jgi:hypothetical protein
MDTIKHKLAEFLTGCHRAPGYSVPVLVFMVAFRAQLSCADETFWNPRRTCEELEGRGFPVGMLEGERHIGNISLTAPDAARPMLVKRGYLLAPKLRTLEDAVADFLATCHAVNGHRVKFAEFYERFAAWNSGKWSSIKVSRALPAEHPSGRGTDNVVFVGNLSFTPEVSKQQRYVKQGKRLVLR